MSGQEELFNLEKRISKVDSDLSKINVIVDRLDSSFEKVIEASGNINILLARHIEKLETQEKTSNQILDLLDEYKGSRDKNFKELNEKFNSLDKKVDEEVDEYDKELFEETIKPLSEKVEKLINWKWYTSGVTTFITIVITTLVNLIAWGKIHL